MAEARAVELEDGGVLSVVELGKGHPLIVLHGGPGLDHQMFRPWLDPLADQGFRLIYVDQRGQGASPRVDPSELSMSSFARDIDRLAQALDLGDYAVLGHSFGGSVALCHALERGSASQYVISAGVASSEAWVVDIERELNRFEPASMRDQIRQSWKAETTVATVQEARELTEAQMPFHFWELGDAYSQYVQNDHTVYAPEVIAQFAAENHDGFEWVDHLRWIRRPMLVMCGRYDRTCTLARSEEIHAEVEDSELVVIEKASHMSFVEQPKVFLDAVRAWFITQGVLPDPALPPAA